MYRLAKLGFSQSYTYFTWRNTKHELTEYFTELARDGATISGRISGRTRPTSCTSTCRSAAGRRSCAARCSRRRSARATASTAPRSSCSRRTPREPGSRGVPRLREIRGARLGPAPRDSLARVSRAPERDPPRQPGAAIRRDTCASTTIDNEQLICYSKHSGRRRQHRARRRQPRPASRPERLHRAAARRMAHGRGQARTRRTSSCPSGRYLVATARATSSRSTPRESPRARVQAAPARRDRAGLRLLLSDLKRRPLNEAAATADDIVRTIRSGTRTRSSISCTCARSSTRTTTASAISGAHREARLHRAARRQRDLAAAVLPLADARRRLRHRRLLRYQSRLRHARDFATFVPRRTSAGSRSSRSSSSTTPRTSIRGSSGARSAPRDSPKRDFYVWSDTDKRFPETRIIFTDTEQSNWAWDPVAEPVLLAPLLLASARLEPQQSRRS